VKSIILIIFILFSTVEKRNYYVKLENYTNYTKYVKVKYENNKDKTTTKEIKIRPKGRYEFFVHDPIFYVYSVSFHRGGKVRAGTHGKDGIGFFRTMIKGKTAYYQKIDCNMMLRGVFKTVHLGV
jgi:hypothetical protein